MTKIANNLPVYSYMRDVIFPPNSHELSLINCNCVSNVRNISTELFIHSFARF